MKNCAASIALFVAAIPIWLGGFNASGWGATGARTAIPSALNQSPLPQPLGFNAVKVISASNVSYPLQTTAEGIVVFEVSVNSSGEVTGMEALTNIPPLTGAAEASLQSWKFAPASQNNAPISSQILVAFAFRHAVKIWSPPPFTAVFAPREQAGYMPPGIFAASYAEYPASTIASGATVVQVSVLENGDAGNIEVLRSMGPDFSRIATQTAEKWQFEPAVLDGTQVRSSVAIAFVFSSRALNPF